MCTTTGPLVLMKRMDWALSNPNRVYPFVVERLKHERKSTSIVILAFDFVESFFMSKLKR